MKSKQKGEMAFSALIFWSLFAWGGTAAYHQHAIQAQPANDPCPQAQVPNGPNGPGNKCMNFYVGPYSDKK